MKLKFVQNKNEFISVMLLVLSAVFAVCILFKVAGFFTAKAGAETLIKKAVGRSKTDPNEVEKYLSKSRALADELKKKNLFSPPQPKQHPVKQVAGILGDEVLINGKWYKAGDKIGDAKIVAIEPTQVKIVWDGKEKVFAPIAATSASEPEKKPKKRPANKAKKRSRRRQKPVEEKVVAPVEEHDPLAWMGVKLSAKVRAKLLEKWNTLSDEEKEKFKEHWNSMSDEQKQQAIDAWEQHL